MKNKYIISSFLGLSLLSMSFILANDSGKVGFTGSPGENTCANGANCHSQFSLNSGPGSVSISTNIPNGIYVPGTTYQIAITVRQTGMPLFGFGCEALNSSNQNAGTLVVTDAIRTKKQNATNGRANMTHQTNGGLSADSATFTFNWTAPATNVGDVTFYFTGNATNNNNNSGGDYVYSGTYVVNPLNNTGIEENLPFVQAITTQILSSNDLQVNYTLADAANVQLGLVGMDGKIIKQTPLNKQSYGTQSTVISMNNLMSGTYIVYIMANGKTFSHKLGYIKK